MLDRRARGYTPANRLFEQHPKSRSYVAANGIGFDFLKTSPRAILGNPGLELFEKGGGGVVSPLPY
jgi:hypothetical protein